MDSTLPESTTAARWLRRVDPLVAIFVAVQLLAGGVAAGGLRVRDEPIDEPALWAVVATYARVFTPTLTAILLLGWSGGGGAVRELLRRLLRWRASIRLYLAAIAIPLVALLVGAIVEGERPTWRVGDLRPPFDAVMLIPVASNVFVPWLAIEPGMRGFLQERAKATRRPLLWAVGIGLLGSVALGFPLVPSWFGWQSTGRLLVVNAGVAVLAGWLYLRSGGSLLLSGMAVAGIGVASTTRIFLFHQEAGVLAGDVLDGGVVLLALVLLLHELAPVLRRWALAGTPRGEALRRAERAEEAGAKATDASRSSGEAI